MGLRAATLAGFGVMVQPGDMVPPDLVELPLPHHLPEIGDVEFVVAGASRTLKGPVGGLAEIILGR
jgi:hypothetical protein